MLIILLVLISLIKGKIIEHSMNMPEITHNSWYYLGRETFSPGNSSIQFETRIQGVPFSFFSVIEFAVINQSQWNAKESKCQCNSKHTHNHQIKFNGDLTKTNLSISQNTPTLYYFILRDCPKATIGQRDNYEMRLHYILTIKNNNSHLGHHQDCLFIVLSILITIFLVFRVSKQMKRNQQTDWVQVGFFAGLITRLIASIFKLFVFLLSWNTGIKSNILEIVYLFFQALSESVITSIILFISFGWTIVYLAIEDSQKYIPPMTGYCFLNILLSTFGILNESGHDKYHLYDSIPGLLLVIFKCITFFIFCCGINNSIQKSIASQKVFILLFAGISMLYIILMPLVYYICECFIIPEKQEFYGVVINQIFHLLFNAIFTYSLTVHHSAYRDNRKKNTFLPLDQKFY